MNNIPRRGSGSSKGGPRTGQLGPIPLVRALLLTLILSDPDSTGYALMKRVTEFTGGRIELRTGTVYSELRRLEEQGLVKTRQESGGRQRRTYRLTAKGKRELESLVKDIEQRVSVVLNPLVQLARESLGQPKRKESQED